MGPTGSVRT